MILEHKKTPNKGGCSLGAYNILEDGTPTPSGLYRLTKAINFSRLKWLP